MKSAYRQLKEFYNGKNVLTTGGTGYKGSWMLLMLEKMGANITDISLEPPSNPYLHKVISYKNLFEEKADVRDYEKVKKIMAATKPDIIIHSAAEAVLLNSYLRPMDFYATNMNGTLNVLEAARNVKSAGSIVVVTTDKVFDQSSSTTLAFKEEDKLGGYDPYSSSKACAELITSAYRTSFGLPVSTGRGANCIFGGDWGQNRLVPNLVRTMNKDTNDSYFLRSKKVLIREDAIRPWSCTLDIVYGYLLLAKKTYENPTQYASAYNFSSQYDSVRTVGELTDAFMKACNAEKEKYVMPFTPKHEDKWHEDRTLILDSIKSRVKLGWKSYVGFDDMITSTADWYKAYYSGKDMDTYSRGQLDAYLTLMK